MSDNTKTLENNHKNESKLLPKDFKRTDLGWMPKDWRIVRLGDYTLRVGSGITPKGGSKIYTEEGRPFIRSLNIGWGRLQLENLVFISEKTHSTFNRSQIKKGDVLLNITGASIGRSAVADSRISKGNVNQHVCEIRTKKNKLDSLYLNAFLISKRGQKQIDSFQAGGSRQGLNYSQIKSFLLPLPPITEQRAIATALSDADNLIESLEKLIAKKQDIKKATMQRLLTGKKRLPGFEGEWEVKKLGDLAQLYQPVTISSNKYTKAGFPVYGANGFVGYYNNYNHENYQIIITCRGSTCGTVNKTVDKSWINGNAMVLNCDNNKQVYKVFLYYQMLSQDLSACITGSGQPQIIRNPLADFQIKIPKNKSEQYAISKILSDMDNEIEALEQRLEKTKQIKQGMMQNLLTGKIRLNHD